jgi:hypothetical protein
MNKTLPTKFIITEIKSLVQLLKLLSLFKEGSTKDYSEAFSEHNKKIGLVIDHNRLLGYGDMNYINRSDNYNNYPRITADEFLRVLLTIIRIKEER